MYMYILSSAYCYFCLSITLSSFSFLDLGKPNCFHVSDIKSRWSVCSFTKFVIWFSLATCCIRYSICIIMHKDESDGHQWADGNFTAVEKKKTTLLPGRLSF